MKKKILSFLIAIILAVSCFTVSFNAYGDICPIIINCTMSGTIDGVDDLAWFSYTPEASGTYSFMSFNTPATEGYLFIRETDPDTKARTYVQLAYAINDPNYLENGHNARQFCLTYHLEAGVKYFFAAGWYFSETRTSGSINVKLRADHYDVELDRVEVNCGAELEAFTDGSWGTDADGNSFFFYNLGRIIANTSVTIYYADGTSSTAFGQETIDGYTIFFNHNQYGVHWYPQTNDNYVENTLTISVLDKSAQIDVQIITTPRQTAKGMVTDLLGNPLENAKIIYSGAVLATTDSEGKFSVTSTPGQYVYTIRTDNSIDRKIIIIISAAGTVDYTDQPIAICTCDYLADGIVNAKDFAVMSKSIDGEELEKQKEQFKISLNFTADSYPSQTLC